MCAHKGSNHSTSSSQLATFEIEFEIKTDEYKRVKVWDDGWNGVSFVLIVKSRLFDYVSSIIMNELSTIFYSFKFFNISDERIKTYS